MIDIPGVKQLSDVGEFVSLHTAEAGRGGYPYEFFFRPGDAKPWSVQYGGNGHYFRTLDGVIAYAIGRGWIKETMIETVRAVIELHFKEVFGYAYDGE